MSTQQAELNAFLKKYEEATNTHNFAVVKPLVAQNAMYWFSDGSYLGIDNIEQAFQQTWRSIKNESYVISNVSWIVASSDFSVCTYAFEWNGLIDGKFCQGEGRGTNILERGNSGWQIIHEHLSSIK